MAVSIGSLIMDLRASTTGLKKDAAKAVKQGRRLGNQFAKGVAAGAAVAATLVTKEFAGFQKAFAEVKTITKGTATEMRLLENQTTSLSMKLGTDLTKSAEGLYQTISAGIPKENAITFMEVASKGAIAGVTEVSTAVDGLSTVINAWGLEATEAGRVSDVMFTTVKNGKTTFEELSGSIADVAPLASSMGVSFEEIFAATATLTKQGTKTSVAMTQIRSSLVALTKPTADMQVLFKRLNVETGQQLLDQFGLVGSMEKLNSVASRPELAKALGRVEGLSGVLGLTGVNARTFAKDLEDMNSSAGATDEAFAIMQNTLVAFAKNVKSIILGTIFPLMAEGFDSMVAKAGGLDNLLLSTRENITDFVTIIVKGMGFVGNAMKGWELIIKTGRVAFSLLFEGILGSAALVVKAFNFVNSKLSSMVNLAIDGANKLADIIPGIDAKITRLSTTAGSEFTATMDQMHQAAVKARQQMVGELVSAFEEPLPSSQIDAWLAEVNAKTKEAATSIGATVEQMRSDFKAPVIPEEVVADTVDKSKRIGKSIESNFTSPVQTGLDSVNSQISGLVRNTQTVDDALTDVAQTITTSVIQSFVTMGVQMLTSQATMAMGIKSIQTGAMAASSAAAASAGGAALASWAPAAMAASIATLGGAAGAGISAYTLALAGGMAATVAIGGLGNIAMTAVGLGTGKKDGGPVSPGMAYPIHEEGLPEFFKPDVSGTVIPLSDMPGGESNMRDQGGVNVNVNQTFTGGVTEADLRRSAEDTRKNTIEAIFDGIARGGSFRKKMKR